MSLRDLIFGRSERERREAFRGQVTVGVDMASGPDTTVLTWRGRPMPMPELQEHVDDMIRKNPRALEVLRASLDSGLAQQASAESRAAMHELYSYAQQAQARYHGGFGQSAMQASIREMQFSQELQLMQNRLAQSMALPRAILGIEPEGQAPRTWGTEHMLTWDPEDNSPEELERRTEAVRTLVEQGMLNESTGAALLGIEATPDPERPEIMNKPRLPPKPEPAAPREFTPGRTLNLED